NGIAAHPAGGGTGAETPGAADHQKTDKPNNQDEVTKMATIVTRELPWIVEQEDGSQALMLRGKVVRTFTTKLEAERQQAKYEEKRYDARIRINGKQIWKTFTRRKEAEAYQARTSTDIQDGTYREIKPATFGEYVEQHWKPTYLIIGSIDEN